MGLKKISHGVLLAVIALVVVVLASEDAALSQNVIKIGQSTALSGPSATWGVGARRAAEIAVEEVNAKGGVKGRKLQYTALDGEHNPVKDIANYRQLVEKEKVVALLGASNSASMLAVAPILNTELKVPLICPATDATAITENEAWQKGDPNYLFRYGMFGRGQSRAMVMFAVEKFGYKNVSLLTWTAGWGVTGRGEILKRLEELKMKPVADETYDAADTDMTPQILKIKNAKADIILNYGLPRENTYVVRTKNKLGDKTPYLSAWGIASDSFWEAAKEFAEGSMTTTTITPYGPQPPKVQKFLEKYYSKHGKNLEAIPATFASYDIVHLFAQVMEKVGSEPEAIRKGLEDVTYYNGLVKEFKRPVFTKERHDAFLWNEDFILCRWTKGQLLQIFFDAKGAYVMPSANEKKYIDKKTGDLM